MHYIFFLVLLFLIGLSSCSSQDKRQNLEAGKADWESDLSLNQVTGGLIHKGIS